jgi:isopenicillin-N N-acyltransferase-like protein
MKPRRKFSRAKKGTLVFLSVTASLLVAFGVFFYFAVTLHPPTVTDLSPLRLKTVQTGQDSYACGNGWIRKNRRGLWELYVEGTPFERGVIIGKLSKDLIYRQEKAFVARINELIPSRIYLYGLRLFIAWFNRNLDTYVPEEYKEEIYGVSKSASGEFDNIASSYQRILNYHAAHDIGHALQGMNMVGCTSFSVWDTASADGSLLIGRNFDFYVGDEFAREKMVCFFNPTEGYKFMMVSWGGMIGAVSGMNETGLTVTLNAAQSEPPSSAATPISVIAREILQYARNIDEAFAIARKRQSFVSESIMIGSLQDKKTAIIEKAPSSTVLFESGDSFIISSNHFQSRAWDRDRSKVDEAVESSSHYRYRRVRELVTKYRHISYLSAAALLRDQKGLRDRNIGMGNEKAINQLIAHHSVIFNPARKLVWVSTNPYQLGEYIAYDLAKIFSLAPNADKANDINEESLTIPADPFLSSKEYLRFEEFRRIRNIIKVSLDEGTKKSLDPALLNAFEASNPEYYEVYSLLGDYYKSRRDFSSATTYYRKALEKEVASEKEANEIKQQLSACTKGSSR